MKSQSNHLPLHFVSTLRDEESLSVRQNLDAARVDGDFAIVALVAALYLDRKKQQLEFGEAKPVGGTEKEVQERFEISKQSTTGVSSVVILERATNTKLERLSQTNKRQIVCIKLFHATVSSCIEASMQRRP